MSSSSEKLLRRHTTGGLQKRKANFCSTPIRGKVVSPSSISVSAVGTNSSSSANKQIKTQLVSKNQKRKTQNKVKRKRLRKTRPARENGLRQKEGKSQRDKERPRKKKKSFPIIDLDKEWETCDESIQQHSIEKSESGSKNDVLFKDLGSPERIREAPRLSDDGLVSPILRPREWKSGSPERISSGEEEGILPMKDLYLPHTWIDDSDDEEDRLPLRRESIVKMYLGLREEKRKKADVSIEKCKQWLVDISVPTASSDLLWDNFVRDNREKISKYLASSNTDGERSLKRCRKRNNENDKSKNSKKQDNYEAIISNEKEFKPKLHKSMDVVRGCWNKTLKKWERVYDSYSFPDGEDFEFEGYNGIGKRMTLNQFLVKCKSQKEKEEKISLSSSLPIHLQNVEKNVTDLISIQKKNKKKNVRLCENFKSKFKRLKPVLSKISDLELRRISDVYKFASRLNKKEKTIISNEKSLASTSKNTKSKRTVTSLKRVIETEMHDREDNCKEQKLIKPKITSIQTLNTIKYQKQKQNWRSYKTNVL